MTARRAWLLLVLVAGCARPPLRVGSTGDYPPFSERTAAGTWGGFDIEVARAYARERRRRLEIVPVRWPDLEPALGRGDFDVAMSGVTVRADRLLAGRFTSAVARAEAVLAAPRGTRAPRRVGVNRGGHLERVARATLEDVEIVTVDQNRLRSLLDAGAVDAVVTDGFELRALGRDDLTVLRTLSNDRKAYFLPAAGGILEADLDAWLAARERDGWLPAARGRLLGAHGPAPAPATVMRVTDLIARRLMLMPAVAAAKHAAGIGMVDAARETEVEARAVARAANAGLAPEPYRRLVRAQIAAARAVQEATLARAGDAPPAPALADVRAAIDRVDDALLPALVAAVPITVPPAILADAVRRDAAVPGLSEEVVRPVADALAALTTSPVRTGALRSKKPFMEVRANVEQADNGAAVHLSGSEGQAPCGGGTVGGPRRRPVRARRCRTEDRVDAGASAAAAWCAGGAECRAARRWSACANRNARRERA